MPKCTVFSALKSFFSYCCFCFFCITLWCCTTSETCLQDRVSLVSHCWETSFHLISRQRSSPVRLKGGCYKKVGKDFGRKPQLLNSCDPSGIFQWKTPEKLHSKLQFYCNLIWMNCMIVYLGNSVLLLPAGYKILWYLSSISCRNLVSLGKLLIPVS